MPGAAAVAAGVLIRDGGRLLLGLRSMGRRWYPGVWDLPGGHIEPGERPSAALVRELGEELAIDVVEPSDLCHFRLVTSGFDMQVWVITDWSGTPRNASPDEHDEVGWFSASEAAELRLADERYPSLLEDAVEHARGRGTR